MTHELDARYFAWNDYSTKRGLAYITHIDGFTTSNSLTRDLILGKPLTRIPKLTAIDYKPGRYTDRLSAYHGILVSPALRKVLRAERSASLQFLPLRIRGVPKLEYFVVNVLDVIDAVDLERSKVRHPKGMTIIDKLAFHELPADGPSIFKPLGLEHHTFVREDLKKKLEAAVSDPGTFTPLEKVRQYA